MTEAALELIEQLEERDRRDGIVQGSMTRGGPRVIEGGRRHTWAELLRLKTAVRRQAFDRTPATAGSTRQNPGRIPRLRPAGRYAVTGPSEPPTAATGTRSAWGPFCALCEAAQVCRLRGNDTPKGGTVRSGCDTVQTVSRHRPITQADRRSNRSPAGAQPHTWAPLLRLVGAVRRRRCLAGSPKGGGLWLRGVQHG
jgi:hypothetical protein